LLLILNIMILGYHLVFLSFIMFGKAKSFGNNFRKL